MFGTVFYVATAVIGIAVGWDRDVQGDLVYVIQIEPEAIESMVEGTPIESSIPPGRSDIRHLRFQIGREQLNPLATLPLPPLDPSASQPETPGGPTQEKSNGDFLGLPDLPSTTSDPGPSESPKFDGFKTPKPPADNNSSPPAPSPSNNSALKIMPKEPDILPISQEQPAVHYQPVGKKEPIQKDQSDSTSENTSSASLVFAWCTAAGLAAALIYLAWIHLGMRHRYQTLLVDYQTAVGSVGSGQ